MANPPQRRTSKSNDASGLDRLAFGHAGDAALVGQGISELRIHYGPGYRIYFQKQGNTIIVLLCGGNKSTQQKDIETAKRLVQEWKAKSKEQHG